MLFAQHKVADVAREMLQALLAAAQIETEKPREVQLDLEAVLNEYLRTEAELTQKAREIVESRGLAPKELGRVLRTLAEQKQFKLGEDALDYLLEQLIEMVMASDHVEEVFAEDHELRRTLREPLRRQMVNPQELDQAVRAQLKHVQEGTSVWEVEYRRMMEEIKRRRGL